MAEKTPAKKNVVTSTKKVDPRSLKGVSGGSRISGSHNKTHDAIVSNIRG